VPVQERDRPAVWNAAGMLDARASIVERIYAARAGARPERLGVPVRAVGGQGRRGSPAKTCCAIWPRRDRHALGLPPPQDGGRRRHRHCRYCGITGLPPRSVGSGSRRPGSRPRAQMAMPAVVGRNVLGLPAVGPAPRHVERGPPDRIPTKWVAPTKTSSSLEIAVAWKKPAASVVGP